MTILNYIKKDKAPNIQRKCRFPFWVSAPIDYSIWQRYTSKVWQWTVHRHEKHMLPFSEKCITSIFLYFLVTRNCRRSPFLSNQTISLYCYLPASRFLCSFQKSPIIDNILWTAALMQKLQEEIWLHVLELFTAVLCKKPNSAITEGLNFFPCISFCKKQDWDCLIPTFPLNLFL